MKWNHQSISNSYNHNESINTNFMKAEYINL